MFYRDYLVVGQNPVPPVNVLFRRSGTAHIPEVWNKLWNEIKFSTYKKYITKISIGISRQAYPSYVHAATDAYAHK